MLNLLFDQPFLYIVLLTKVGVGYNRIRSFTLQSNRNKNSFMKGWVYIVYMKFLALKFLYSNLSHASCNC